MEKKAQQEANRRKKQEAKQRKREEEERKRIERARKKVSIGHFFIWEHAWTDTVLIDIIMFTYMYLFIALVFLCLL